MAAFGPIFVQLYGQGEAPMTITGLRRADHLDADDAILGSVGYARSGVDVAVLATDGSPAGVDRDRRNRLPRRRCHGRLLEEPRRDGVDPAGRLAAHRRHGVLRCAWVPDPARPLQGRGDQRWKQHLPPRGGRGADRAPRRFGGRASSARRTRSGARSSSRSSWARRRRPNWTRICWSASRASSDPSATSSSTRFRRTATARCSSGSCGSGSASARAGLPKCPGPSDVVATRRHCRPEVGTTRPSIRAPRVCSRGTVRSIAV